VHLEQLEEDLGLSFGDVEEETLGGYIFGRLAREVHVGDELSLEGVTLRVEAVEGLRVTEVRICFEPLKRQVAPKETTQSEKRNRSTELKNSSLLSSESS